jgi:hypothetical protein
VDVVKKSNRGVNLIKIQDSHRRNTPFINKYVSRNVWGLSTRKDKGECRGKRRANTIETVYIVG